MTIRAIIIDDEEHCIRTLSHDLKAHCPQVTVLGKYTSATEGLEAIFQMQPDLIFLDIEMPHLNGFDLLEKLGDKRSCNVIFTTAYDQFILRALRMSAIDYLLKPIDAQDLLAAVLRCEEHINLHKFTDDRVPNLLYNRASSDQDIRIALPNRTGYEFVYVKDIVYCNADGAYTTLMLSQGRTVFVSRSLGQIESLLPAELFMRIHHSTIVNIDKVAELQRVNGLILVMTGGERLNVSRSKKDQLLLRLGIKS